MKRVTIGAIACAASLLLGSAVTLAQAQWVAQGEGQGGGGSPCGVFNTLSTTTTAAPGVTNGAFGTPLPGEVYTVSVSGPGSGSFRIVGDPGGTVTYAGPATVPGSLSFSATGAPPVGAVGIGYFFDAGAGTVTITTSCSVFSNVPAVDRGGLLLLALLGGAIGLLALRMRS